MSKSNENEFEASWAPKDPRDKLYEVNVTRVEKVGSLFRVVAAFHPVLNLPVLVYDSFKRIGFSKTLFLWVTICAALVASACFLSG